MPQFAAPPPRERCAQELSAPDNWDTPAAHIASQWGFSDSAYFSRAFKKRFGLPPAAYRARSFFVQPQTVELVWERSFPEAAVLAHRSRVGDQPRGPVDEGRARAGDGGDHQQDGPERARVRARRRGGQLRAGAGRRLLRLRCGRSQLLRLLGPDPLDLRRSRSESPAFVHGAIRAGKARRLSQDLEATLRQLHTATENTTRLVNQLLSLARAEPGEKREHATQPLDLVAEPVAAVGRRHEPARARVAGECLAIASVAVPA